MISLGSKIITMQALFGDYTNMHLGVSGFPNVVDTWWYDVQEVLLAECDLSNSFTSPEDNRHQL